MDSLFLQNEFNRSCGSTHNVSILILMDSLFLRTFEKTLYLSMLQEFFQTLKSHFFD